MSAREKIVPLLSILFRSQMPIATVLQLIMAIAQALDSMLKGPLGDLLRQLLK